MSANRTTILFTDASSLVAAAGSPTGGSSFLLSVCQRGFLLAAVSDAVLAEAARNATIKLRPAAMERYQALLHDISFLSIEVTPDLQQPYLELAGAKDAHVVAGAIAIAAPYLITLDKRLARRVNGAALPLVALSPGEFIQSVLPTHPDYAAMRQQR